MNIVIVNDTGIEIFKSWTQVKKYTSFEKEDFTEVGPNDFILECNNQTYEVSKDIKLLERVASEQVFSKTKFEINNIAIWGAAVFSLLIYLNM